MENDAGNPKLGFLSLPPEVRNMIYDELFEDTKLEFTMAGKAELSIDFLNTARPLLSTCKTINIEARRLLEENTTLYIDSALIRDAHSDAKTLSKSVGVESFTRKMKINGVLSFCGFTELNLSAYQNLTRLEFRLEAYSCCVRKRLQVWPGTAGQTTANILQRGWLDDARRGWGLSRRIDQVEVTVDPDDVNVYCFRMTICPRRPASRRLGRINVSYQED